MNSKLLFAAVFTVTLVSCNPAQQSNTAVVADDSTPKPAAVASVSCEMTMGLDAWEPYQYMTVGNKVAGLDVELVQAVAKGMDCKLNVVQGSWLELLTLLKEGNVDFVLGASKTEDREKFAYFSEPYRQERFQLYVRNEHANLDVADLKAFVEAGHKVGVVNEYYYGDDVATLYADDKLRSMFIGAIISELNVARLLDEEIDGLLEDSFVGASLLRRKGLDKYIKPHKISMGNSDVYVMFSRASVTQEQVNQFNQAMEKLKNDGGYARLLDKYRN